MLKAAPHTGASVSSQRHREDIESVEPKRPGHLTISFESDIGLIGSTVEFNTDESASDLEARIAGRVTDSAATIEPQVYLFIIR